MLYVYIFKKEGILKFNRYYLLFSLTASFLFPFMKLSSNIPPEISNKIYNTQYITPLENNWTAIPEITSNENFTEEITKAPITNNHQAKTITQNSTTINYWQITLKLLIGAYLLGVIALLFSFLFQLIQTLRLFKHYTIENISNAKIIQHNLEIMPFSIFNYIIINKNNYREHELEYVLMHEMEHINQKHSFDILLIELLKIIFWINPVIWFYEREMKQNHEYLADRGVLEQGAQIFDYQTILSTSSLGVPKYNIVNNFNQSYIKKRITMMTSKSSNKLSMWKLLLIIPVVFTAILACAKPSSSNPVKNPVFAAIENPIVATDEAYAKPSSSNSVKSPVVAITESPVVATDEITDFTKYIELNTPYDWVSYLGSELFCKGTYTINKINDDGSFEGLQINHTRHAYIPVTGILTKNKFEIYTGDPWNEIWTIKSSENGKLYGEMFADYALAKRNKQTFYLAKKIGYDELLPALQSQPGEEISKNLHLKLYEKYFYETFGNNGELAMTGWFMITNFNKTTHEISGHQWNYIGQCAGAFSGSLYDDSITINIGEPWNEVWRAKLEGDLLKGTLKMNPTEVGFVHQIQSWVMANINHPILTAEKIAKLKIPYNIARYSEMEENLNSLLTQNMKYPEQAKKDKIEGRVYVSFTVKADGSIANLKVARKVNPLLDEEALRLVNLTDKKWAPAIIDGKPVDSEYMMPIIFRLDKEQANSAQTPVILKGTVIDKGTKKPLANVFIVEFDKNGRFLSGTTTDSNGDYVIKLIDATNSIQVSLNNYKKSTYRIDGITTINIELESEN